MPRRPAPTDLAWVDLLHCFACIVRVSSPCCPPLPMLKTLICLCFSQGPASSGGKQGKVGFWHHLHFLCLASLWASQLTSKVSAWWSLSVFFRSGLQTISMAMHAGHGLSLSIILVAAVVLVCSGPAKSSLGSVSEEAKSAALFPHALCSDPSINPFAWCRQKRGQKVLAMASGGQR